MWAAAFNRFRPPLRRPRPPPSQGAPCFNVRRLDGTTEDFSFRKCFDPDFTPPPDRGPRDWGHRDRPHRQDAFADRDLATKLDAFRGGRKQRKKQPFKLSALEDFLVRLTLICMTVVPGCTGTGAM